jgi:hypothetical protein
MTNSADRDLAAAMRSVVESAAEPIDPRDIVDGRVVARHRRLRPLTTALVVVPFVVVAVLIAALVGRDPSPHRDGVIARPPPLPSTTSQTTLHPLVESQILAWTRDGRLVVLDANGRTLRQLAKIRAGQIGVGPSNVVLTPDRTQAIVSWEVGEPGCFFRIGMVPVDGSAPLAAWGEGTSPSFSPDGRRVAWREVNNADCVPQAIVVRDLASGLERRIDVNDRSGYSPAGPWWQSDSRTVLFGAANQALDGSTVAAVAVDADRATSIHDGVATTFECASNTTALAFASQTLGSSALIVATTGNNGGSFPILQCALDGSPPHELARSPVFIFGARPDRQGRHFLAVTQNSKLIEITPGAPPRTLSSEPFQSATW